MTCATALKGGILRGLSGRAVFVVADDRTVTYRWDGDGLRELPDFDAIGEAVASAER